MSTTLDCGNAAAPAQAGPQRHPSSSEFEPPSPAGSGTTTPAKASSAHLAPSTSTPSPITPSPITKAQEPPSIYTPAATSNPSMAPPPRTPDKPPPNPGHPAPTPPPASLLPRLAFPNPATERAFRSYSAIHRPISDAAAALIVLFAIFPSVGIRAATLHVCPCLSDPSQTLCQFPPYAAPARAQQLLGSFPCSGTWPQQFAWWACHWPRTLYLVLLRSSAVEFGWMFWGMVLLVLLTPVARTSWYHRLRLAVVLAMRMGTFVVSAAAVLALKPREQPSYVDVHFSRYTMWGATALMWHCLMHAVPFDVHVHLAPLELVAVAICVFARNPHLLTPASAAPILFYQLGIGLLLPTCVLYIMEASQRRQFLSRQNREQRLQSPGCSLRGQAGVVGVSESGGKQCSSADGCDAPAASSSCAVRGSRGMQTSSAQHQQKQQQECQAPGQPASQNGIATMQREPAAAAAAKQAAPAAGIAVLQEPGPMAALPAASEVVGKVSQKPSSLDSLYRPFSSCLLASIKIPHPPASMEQDPSALIHSVHASTLRTINAAPSSMQPGAVLRMKHAVIKGCIQLLLWVQTGPPARQRGGVTASGSGPTSGSGLEMGGGLTEAGSVQEGAAGTWQMCAELQSELEAAARAAATEVCAAAGGAAEAVGVEVESSGVGSISGEAGATASTAATEVFVSSLQLHGASMQPPHAWLGTRQEGGLEVVEGTGKMGGRQGAGVLVGWEGAVFWVEGGAVCCEEGQKELRVCVGGGGAGLGVCRGDAAGEGVVGGVRAVFVDARSGGLLLDVRVAVDFDEEDSAVLIRVPLPAGSLPATPTPLQLLLLPANDTQGTVLWSCPLLAGMPPAITTELHSLFPSMLDGQAALDSQHSSKQPGRGGAGKNGMPDAHSVDLAALEAKVSQEVYLPFISELSLVAWPPADLAALMSAAAAPYCTPSSTTAASRCAEDEQQALTLHVSSFLKANDLDHTLAWLGCMVDHQASALPPASAKQQLLPNSTLPQRCELGSPITWEIPVAANCVSRAGSYSSACSDPWGGKADALSAACTSAAEVVSEAAATVSSKPLRKALLKASLHPAPLLCSTKAILTAVLHHSFPGTHLEYQYQQYQLDSAAALDRQGCLLQMALTIAQMPKATSLCETSILTTTLVSLVVAMRPVLLNRRWPSYQWRQRAMLVPQLMLALPAMVYLVSGWPFPTVYKQIWQRYWLVPLGYCTLLAVWQQSGIVQTAVRSAMHVTLYLPLIQLETAASHAPAFLCMVAGQTVAAAAMEFVQRRAFLRRLQLQGC